MSKVVTLDDDVAAKVDEEATRAQRSFEDVVNDAIRRGLEESAPPVTRKPFKVRARDLGLLVDIECTSRVLDELDDMERK